MTIQAENDLRENKAIPINVLSDEIYEKLVRASLAPAERPRTKQAPCELKITRFASRPAKRNAQNPFLPEIKEKIKEGSSFVVTDPGRKLFEQTSRLAEESGYRIRVLDLTRPDISDGWNPFDVFRGEDVRMHEFTAFDMANILLSNATACYHDRGPCEDADMSVAEETMLRNVIMYVASPDHYKGRESERNIDTVYRLLEDLSVNKTSKELDRQPYLSASGYYWHSYRKVMYNIHEIASDVAEKLRAFRTGMIGDMLSHSEIDLTAPAREKCAYYVIPSNDEEVMRNLLSLFFSCEMRAFRQAADEDKAKVPVFIGLSNFDRIQWIPNFAVDMTQTADSGISVMITARKPGLIKVMYQEEADDILDNCDIVIL